MGFIIMISVVCVSIWYQRNYFLIESIKERNVSQNEVQLVSLPNLIDYDIINHKSNTLNVNPIL